jgi:hypothetical protein
MTSSKLDRLVSIGIRLVNIQLSKGKTEEALKTFSRIQPYAVIRHGEGARWFNGMIDRIQENLR